LGRNRWDGAPLDDQLISLQVVGDHASDGLHLAQVGLASVFLEGAARRQTIS
jgi:hypothetical protein